VLHIRTVKDADADGHHLKVVRAGLCG
jgi:hypothetical protein